MGTTQSVSTRGYKAIFAVLIVILSLTIWQNLALASENSRLNAVIKQPLVITVPESATLDPNTTTPLPQLVVWSTCFSNAGCVMNPSGWRQYIVPDTFDLYVSFKSTVNVTVYFLTLGQYAQLVYCKSISCVPLYYQSIAPTTNIQNRVFKLAEGCDDYVAIFQPISAGIMYPNISISHNPAPSWTGICTITGPE